MAGYSGTPLLKKLGIRPGFRVLFIAQPHNYSKLLGPLPGNVTVLKRAATNIDFIHGFVTRTKALDTLLARAGRCLSRDGMLWVSWPKKASHMKTEVSEAEVRRAGLAAGLVDVKICAVDETWSGLRFVYRLKDR